MGDYLCRLRGCIGDYTSKVRGYMGDYLSRLRGYMEDHLGRLRRYLVSSHIISFLTIDLLWLARTKFNKWSQKNPVT